MRFQWLIIVLGTLACGARGITPTLTEVVPAVLTPSGGAVELHGEGFLPAGTYDFDAPVSSTLQRQVQVVLSQGDQQLELPDAVWVDPQRINARVPEGLALGLWSVQVTTPRGVAVSKADALRIEPPTVELGDPDGGDDAGPTGGGNDGGSDGGLRDGGAVDAGPGDGGTADGGPLRDGGADAGPDAGPSCTSLTFRDDDGDGYGRPNSQALLCGPGRAAVPGDCDDTDRRISPDAVEVCNGVDDDCDNQVDEEACGDAGLVWTVVPPLPGNPTDLVAASAWGTGQLWITGDRDLYGRYDDTGFFSASSGCPMNLRAVWSDPSSGQAFVAGGNNGVGRLATAYAGGCGNSVMVPDPVAGLVGFTSQDSGVQVEVVMRSGRTTSWDGVGSVGATTGSAAGLELVDAHGATPGSLFAVGATTSTPRRPVVARLVGGAFVSQALPAGLPDGTLRGVWAVSDTEVIVVGDEGMVLRLANGTWTRLASPTVSTMTSVVAFGLNRFYVTDEGGALRQWNGAWQVRYIGSVPLRDVTAVDEQHFWVVGDNGVVIRGVVP